MTHSTRSATRAFRVSASGFGFAGNTHPAAGPGVAVLKPPRPPPCVVPGKKYRRTLAGSGMSAFASVPTRFGDSRRYQNSRAPNVSMIFGHVFVVVHRSSSPADGRCRAVSA